MLLFVRGYFPVTIRLSVPEAASGISDAAGQPPDLAVRGQPAPPVFPSGSMSAR